MKKRAEVGEAEVLRKLRDVALSLTDATETRTFGHPTFQVKKKTFAVLETYHGELSICFKAEREAQHHLTETDPRYYVTPYSGKHGWVSLRVHAAPLDWKEIAGHLAESHRLVVRPPMRKKR